MHLYDLSNSIVVIIDVFRATSTIATALHNGARCVIPVDSVSRCIEIGKNRSAALLPANGMEGCRGAGAWEFTFRISKGICGRPDPVLTTTNGTRLLQMALDKAAGEIITGAFANISAVCDHLLESKRNVILGLCGLEGSCQPGRQFVCRRRDQPRPIGFTINCDSSHLAEQLYVKARCNLFRLSEENNASHYQRLMGFGLEKDMRYCLADDGANVLPIYADGN